MSSRSRRDGNPRVEYGGYDYEFHEPIPDECHCLVCTFVQRDPYQVTCCGQIFCRTCLDQLVDEGQRCPNCRSDSIRKRSKNWSRIFQDLSTARKIRYLRMNCVNKKHGCEWVGHLKDFEDTHRQKCLNDYIPCNNVKDPNFNHGKSRRKERCGKLVQRMKMEEHENEECEWRKVTCEYCHTRVGSYRYITDIHHDMCPDVTITCANEGCEEELKRKDMDLHCCPKEELDCRYSHVGCTAKITREDRRSHETQHVADHLYHMTSSLRELKESVRELEHKWETTAAFQELEDRIDGLEYEMAAWEGEAEYNDEENWPPSYSEYSPSYSYKNSDDSSQSSASSW